MLERNGHGGDWVTAGELFGHAEHQLLDYSANINPLGPPAGLEEHLAREWKRLIRYPDPQTRGLRAKLAGIYEIAPASILAGNGAAELLDLIVRVVSPRRAVVVEPAFVEYAEALAKAGAEIVRVQAEPAESFRLPFERLLALCSAADLMFLGHPNNPTSQRFDPIELEALANEAERTGTTIVLDEAFIDFSTDEAGISMIRRAPQSGSLVVVRSMTKFYAIPGLRLGFAVARPETIARLRRLQIPWSVNHLAQAAGEFVLDDAAYAVRTRSLIAQERSYLTAALTGLGCSVYAGETNFLLVRLPEPWMDASVLQRLLAEQGVLIRRCASFRGLDDGYFRMAVRLRAENERFLHTLQDAVAELAAHQAKGERDNL